MESDFPGCRVLLKTNAVLRLHDTIPFGPGGAFQFLTKVKSKEVSVC